MDIVLLDPPECTATYQAGVLTIHATGHEEGVTEITIEQDGLEPIEPPQFRVQGMRTPAIGMFPYDVEDTFRIGADPHEIALQTPAGTRMIPVRSLASMS
jgi:hypothetical protein